MRPRPKLHSLHKSQRRSSAHNLALRDLNSRSTAQMSLRSPGQGAGASYYFVTRLATDGTMNAYALG
jgi:hypothetical protein